jgi:signal transduction histidine kinase
LFFKNKPLSLTTRFRATSFIPALVVSVVMGITIFTVLEYRNREILQTSAQKTIETMRVLFQGPLISGDTTSANSLMQSIMSDPDLVSVKVFDISGELFAEGTNDGVRNSKTLPFSEKIYRESLPVAIWDDEDSSLPAELGHIELVLGRENSDIRKNRVMFFLYAVTLFALLVSVWLGRRIGMSILRPLGIIGETVTQIRAGNYSTTNTVIKNDELGLLSDNILHLASELNSKDEAIDEQMAELLYSREELIRHQEENSELLNDLINEYSNPLISAVASLQNASSVVTDGAGADLIGSALRNIEYLLEMSGDFGYLVDQSTQSETLRSVAVQINTLTNSVISSFAQQCSARDVSIVHDAEEYNDLLDQEVYSDPIRIRVLLKNVLEYAVQYSPAGGSISIRTMVREQSNRAVVIMDVFDDTRHFSDKALSVLARYFSNSQDFLEQDEYLSIPIEYRTANRVARSLNGNLSINRCLNGGQILSIQFLAQAEPGALPSLDAAVAKTPRTDILFYRYGTEGNSIADKYLKSKDIEVQPVSSLLSSPGPLPCPDCRLIFVELDLARPEYSQLLRCMELPLQSNQTSVIALIEPKDSDSISSLMRIGFTEVIVKPVTASHICSLIDANSTVNSSMKRIFAS